MATETAAQRYARDYATGIEADRKTRELTTQPHERKGRLYVDSATHTSAVTGDAPTF